MSMLSFNVVPMGKPRMTQRDKWKKRPVVEAYYVFKDALVKEAKKQKYTLGEELKITFFIPMPESWSQKKKDEMYMTPHKQKPDLDNCLKAFQDSLTDDDSGVWHVNADKYWSKTGHIVVAI